MQAKKAEIEAARAKEEDLTKKTRSATISLESEVTAQKEAGKYAPYVIDRNLAWLIFLLIEFSNNLRFPSEL